jgi:hypothetical protein
MIGRSDNVSPRDLGLFAFLLPPRFFFLATFSSCRPARGAEALEVSSGRPVYKSLALAGNSFLPLFEQKSKKVR